MKKIMLFAAALVMLAATSCTKQSTVTEDTTDVDSTEVVTDSVAVDSVVVVADSVEVVK
jgi:ABC-type Zn uptake system ZnuABC Zn-binding protein ZnuA